MILKMLGWDSKYVGFRYKSEQCMSQIAWYMHAYIHNTYILHIHIYIHTHAQKYIHTYISTYVKHTYIHTYIHVGLYILPYI